MAAAIPDRTMANEANRMSRQITQQAGLIENAGNRNRLLNQARRYQTQAVTSSDPEKQAEALAGLEAVRQQVADELQIQRQARRQQQPTLGERLNQSHLVRQSGKERTFADLLVTLGASTITVLWTASRNHQDGSDILWALFWTGLGSVMAVEGNGELAYAGFGVAGADMAYFVLRLVGGIEPKVL